MLGMFPISRLVFSIRPQMYQSCDDLPTCQAEFNGMCTLQPWCTLILLCDGGSSRDQLFGDLLGEQ